MVALPGKAGGVRVGQSGRLGVHLREARGGDAQLHVAELFEDVAFPGDELHAGAEAPPGRLGQGHAEHAGVHQVVAGAQVRAGFAAADDRGDDLAGQAAGAEGDLGGGVQQGGVQAVHDGLDGRHDQRVLPDDQRVVPAAFTVGEALGGDEVLRGVAVVPRFRAGDGVVHAVPDLSDAGQGFFHEGLLERELSLVGGVREVGGGEGRAVGRVHPVGAAAPDLDDLALAHAASGADADGHALAGQGAANEDHAGLVTGQPQTSGDQFLDFQREWCV